MSSLCEDQRDANQSSGAVAFFSSQIGRDETFVAPDAGDVFGKQALLPSAGGAVRRLCVFGELLGLFVKSHQRLFPLFHWLSFNS